MNWLALVGMAIFGGALWFGFAMGTMPVSGSWNPNRVDEPRWFWVAGVIHAFFLVLCTAAFFKLIQ